MSPHISLQARGRRDFLRMAGVSAFSLPLVGCDRAAEIFFPGGPDPLTGIDPDVGPRDNGVDLIFHALNRLSFGPAPGDYARVRALGETQEEAFEVWLDEQLHPDRIDDSECDRLIRRLETLSLPLGELFEYQPGLLWEELARATILRAAYSRRQLYETMAGFWTDHFNIDSSKGDCRWLKTADDRETVRRHPLGKFPDLLRATALSPAMLWYLDGRSNRSVGPQEPPNENYARELLELHTMGVHGGYTQRDVMETARCLSGWTVRSEEWFKKGCVEFRSEHHDDGEKVVLGQTIPAGLGPRDLDRVIEITALHPSTARCLAVKLCRRFISDSPPSPAVDAVQRAFIRSEGDIPETLRALFATEDFRNARATKFKRPFRFIVSALRAVGARTAADRPLWEYLVRMGHAPFQHPTPDGPPDEAPPWLGTLYWRWSFAMALCSNRIKGTEFPGEELKRTAASDSELIARFLGRTPSDLETHTFSPTPEGVALILASPAFQRC